MELMSTYHWAPEPQLTLKPILLPSPPVNYNKSTTATTQTKSRKRRCPMEPSSTSSTPLPSISTLFHTSPSLSTTSTSSSSSYCQFSPDTGTFSPYTPSDQYVPYDYYTSQNHSVPEHVVSKVPALELKDYSTPLFIDTTDYYARPQPAQGPVQASDLLLRPVTN